MFSFCSIGLNFLHITLTTMHNRHFSLQTAIFIASLPTVYTSIWNNYFAVPGELLNRRDLDALGLHAFTESAQLLNVSSLGRIFQLNIATPDSSILVPPNTSLLFLFNSTSHGSSWDFADNNGYMSEQFVQTSLPVGLPQYHYIVNLFLMVPFLHSEGKMEKFPFVRSDVWMSRIGFPYQQTPLTDKMIRNKSSPLMVFTFHSGDETRNFLAGDESYGIVDNSSYTTAKQRVSDALLLSSSEVAKAVIATSDNFFDNFARVWVQALGVDTLFYSLFCQINVNIQELSYCLRFIDSGAEVSVLTKHQYSNDSVPIEFEMSVDRSSYWPTSSFDVVQKSRKLRKLFSTFADSIRIDNPMSEQETLRKLLSTSLTTSLPKITRYVYTLSLKWQNFETDSGPGLLVKRAMKKSIQWRPLLRNNISPKQVSNSGTNCTVITWRKVFLHSLFGEDMNFCSIEAADEKKRSSESN